MRRRGFVCRTSQRIRHSSACRLPLRLTGPFEGVRSPALVLRTRRLRFGQIERCPLCPLSIGGIPAGETKETGKRSGNLIRSAGVGARGLETSEGNPQDSRRKTERRQAEQDHRFHESVWKEMDEKVSGLERLLLQISSMDPIHNWIEMCFSSEGSGTALNIGRRRTGSVFWQE